DYGCAGSLKPAYRRAMRGFDDVPGAVDGDRRQLVCAAPPVGEDCGGVKEQFAAFRGGGDRLGLQHIPVDNFGRQPIQATQVTGLSHEGTHLVASGAKLTHEVCADQAVRTRHQCLHTCTSPCRMPQSFCMPAARSAQYARASAPIVTRISPSTPWSLPGCADA